MAQLMIVCVFFFVLLQQLLSPHVSAATSSYISSLTSAQVCRPTVSFVDSSGHLITACTSLGGVLRSHSDGDQYYFVANTSICPNAEWVIEHPTTGSLFVACAERGCLQIDSNGVASTLLNSTECSGAVRVELSPDGQYVIASCGNGVVRVDVNTNVTGSSSELQVTTLLSSDECANAVSAFTYLSETSVEFLVAACATNITQKNLNTGELTTLATPSECDQPSSVSRDDATGDIYFSCMNSGLQRLFRNGTRNVLATAQQCSQAIHVKYHPRTGTVFGACQTSDPIAVTPQSIVSIVPYVSCIGSRSISFVDKDVIFSCYDPGAIRVSSTTILNLVPHSKCENSQDVVFNERNGNLIVSCSTGIVTLSNSVLTQVANASQCRSATNVFQSQVDGQIIAACPFQGLVSINNGTVTTLVDNAGECHALQTMAVNTNTGSIYLGCVGSISVGEYDPKSGNLTMLMSPDDCDFPHSLLFDASINAVYVACDQSGIKRINSDGTVSLIADTSVCESPSSLLLSGDMVYATCYAFFTNNAVAGVNLTSSVVSVEMISDLCDVPAAISQNPLTGQLLVSCSSYQTTSIYSIDPQTQVVSNAMSYNECPSPGKAVQDPTSQALLLTCSIRGITSFSQDFRCFEGFEWSFGVCVPCGLNYYRPIANIQSFSQCGLCPGGFITTTTGSISCSPCPIGTFDSRKTCALCPLGKYQPSAGASACIDCGIGSYAITPGSTACSLCEPGFYASTNGSVSCTPCERGSASAEVGLTHSCPGCAAGSYQGGVGKSECVSCEPHTYAERDNSTSCTRCANQVNEEKTACTVIICDANSQFNEVTNNCDLCPLSMYSSRGGLCTVCNPNTYTPAIGSGCAPCDGIEGLNCNGGRASVLPNYWAFISDRLWTNEVNHQSYAVYQTVSCAQGLCPGTQLQLQPDSLNSSVMPVIQYCNFPRRNSWNNTMCAECEENYLAWGDSCVICDKANGGLIFGYLILSFVLVVFLLYSATSTSAAGSTSIFLFFIQTSALEVGPVGRFLDWINAFNLDAKSTATCLAPYDTYGQTLFALFVPLILIGELIIIACVHFSLHRALGSNGAPSSSNGAKGFIMSRIRRFSLDDYRAGGISILLFCYTQVATAALRYLNCIDVGPVRLNFNAPTIDCHSSEYNHYLAPTLLAIILYIVGFPIVAFVMLWRHKDSLYLPSDADVFKSSPEISSFLHRWQPFYRMYHPRAYFWQCWVLLRRAAFVVVAVLLMQQPSERFMAFALLHFASLLLHWYAAPYESPQLNRMETVSYVLLVTMSEFLLGYKPPFPVGIQVLLFFLIVPPAAGMFGVIVAQRYTQWRDKKQRTPGQNLDAADTAQKTDDANGNHHASSLSVEMSNIAEPVAVGTQSILPAYALDSEQQQL